VGWIRRIQGIGYGVLEFLEVGTTFDIFQNIIFIPYFQYGVLVFWIRHIGLLSFVVFVKDDEEEEEDDEEGDDEEEDEEMEESSDSDSMSKDAEDEGPTTKDEDPAAGDEGPTTEDEDLAIGDEGLAAGDEGPGMGVKSLSLGGDESVPKGQSRVELVVETAMGEPLGLGYAALRRREIALGEGRMPSVFEVALLAMDETEGFLTELGARVEMQEGLICVHTVQLEELSPALFERSLEHEQERVAVTFGAIWRPLTEERRAQLDLAEIIDSMRIGQEPRGDV
ncbi:hypothetical protein Tco_1486207, partial [Tanacetum coccineum]